ncbi:MAG: AarF/UbiB family protein [bacterium]
MQLPKGLDLNDACIQYVVPNVHWEYTTDRILCMDFEEAFRSTDIAKIDKAGLDRR